MDRESIIHYDDPRQALRVRQDGFECLEHLLLLVASLERFDAFLSSEDWMV